MAAVMPHDEDVMNLGGGECHGPRERGLREGSTGACRDVGVHQRVVCLGCGRTPKAGLATRTQTGRELMPLS